MFLFCAAVRALDETWPASHLPSAGVASSSDVYLMVYLPTLLPACLERELLAVDNVLGLGLVGGVERQARIDLQRVP